MRVAQVEELFRALLDNLGFRRFHLEYMPLWSYVEFLVETLALEADAPLENARALAGRSQRSELSRQRRTVRHRATALRFWMRQMVARPLYRAAGLPMPPAAKHTLDATRELISTLRPLSEIAGYVGEALTELRGGADLFLNIGPNGCMVASMSEALSPAIVRAAGRGRIQSLFSPDGDLDEDLLRLCLLKTLGPERYYRRVAGGALTAAQ
jgi:hypothetical protein